MKRSAIPLGVLSLSFALVGAFACGGTSSGGQASAPTAAPSSAPTAAPFILTRPGSVAGVGRTVFTDPNGMTLYYETTDAGGKVNCSGNCAVTWPPLLVPAGVTTLPAVSAVPGKFGIVSGADGKSQVAYNTWPLYAFLRDGKPGDQNGEGVAGRWHVASTDLQPSA